MSTKHRWKSLFIVVLALSGLSSLALASSFDAALSWFASRPLSEQEFWDAPHVNDESDFLRQAYLLAELSNRAYRKTADRQLEQLGFHQLNDIHETATMDGGDVGTVVGVGAGGVIDLAAGAVTGGGWPTGFAPVVFGSIGAAKITAMQVDSSAFVAESFDHRTRVVAVRGTRVEALQDWLLDMNAGTIVDDNGKVTYHHGFFLYASVIYDDVRKDLGDACKPGGASVWLTGHSLGGAAAELLAYWLNRDGCHVDGVITFAAPRPGLTDLQSAYNKSSLGDITHRFMNAFDPVVCLPLGNQWADLGHQHSIDYGIITYDDPVDSCTGMTGPRTLGQQVYGFMKKVHDLTRPATKFADWLDSEGKKLEICDDSRVAKAIAVLTLGGSWTTCRTIDLTSDLVHLADILVNVKSWLDSSHQEFGLHELDCGYLDPVTIRGWDEGTFSDPIWAQYFENTWSPPQGCPVPPPVETEMTPQKNAQGCWGSAVCCFKLNGDGTCDECGLSSANCVL